MLPRSRVRLRSSRRTGPRSAPVGSASSARRSARWRWSIPSGTSDARRHGSGIHHREPGRGMAGENPRHRTGPRRSPGRCRRLVRSCADRPPAIPAGAARGNRPPRGLPVRGHPDPHPVLRPAVALPGVAPRPLDPDARVGAKGPARADTRRPRVPPEATSRIGRNKGCPRADPTADLRLEPATCLECPICAPVPRMAERAEATRIVPCAPRRSADAERGLRIRLRFRFPHRRRHDGTRFRRTERVRCLPPARSAASPREAAGSVAPPRRRPSGCRQCPLTLPDRTRSEPRGNRTSTPTRAGPAAPGGRSSRPAPPSASRYRFRYADSRPFLRSPFRRVRGWP